MSLCTMLLSWSAATAVQTCRKTLRASSVVNRYLQNYFHVEIWSGASVLKTKVLISSMCMTGSTMFSRFGWFTRSILDTRSMANVCLDSNKFEMSTKMRIQSASASGSHSIRISPSSLVEYRMSGLAKGDGGTCLYRKNE
jgi:hypothetical protein